MRYSKEELADLRKAAMTSESLVTRKIKRMAKGDYGKLELIQLIGGSLMFYIGTFVKGRGAK